MLSQPQHRRFSITPTIAAFAIAAVLAPSSAHPPTGPDPRVVLYVSPVFTVLYPDGILCVEDREGSWHHPRVRGSTVDGPVDFLSPPDVGFPDGRQLFRVGTRTVVLRMNSSTALVDGRALDLGRPIEDNMLPWGPLERLAPLLGYSLVFGTTPPSIVPDQSWVMRLPKGAPIPR